MVIRNSALFSSIFINPVISNGFDFFRKSLNENLLFHVPVKFHLAGVEQASDPNDSNDEHLLEKKTCENPRKIGLRDDFFEKNINHGHGDLNQKDQIEKSEGGKRMSKHKSESFQSGFENIAALIQNDLDAGIVKDHLDKKKKNKDQYAEGEPDEKRSNFGE
jgi:hypothetical protein